MYSIRPNVLLRSLYTSAIWRVSTKEKKIFLTFDDGPIPEITPWILSTLKQFNAKATFFSVGANIEKYPDVFRQIISEGHSIGNHTYNHLNGWKTKTKKYLEDVEQCEKSLRSAVYSLQLNNNRRQETINRKPLFRPPYGKMKLSQYSILNTQYFVVLWDVLSGDFDEKLSKERCLKNVLSKTRQGSIIVFHDSIKAKEKLFYVLPKALEFFSSEEYALEPLIARYE